ncbi:MAG: UDP-N-acetylmuramoyl-tripeptide--D-alanyl-D-alanine ligase [Nitrosomonas sp.]|nr:MAG: UDP-N-acetylmuramoyl-tripeptide--D-alanyl-D-alanine ligase [Nitrosomonas sp.]
MMTVREAARILSAECGGADVCFTGVSTDSRTLEPGDLFVALTGERFDGNQFINTARQRGAIAVMVRQDTDVEDLSVDLPWIRVQDTRAGLGQLAKHWRSRFTIPLVGVTGSNGKTTVKEMIAAILRQASAQQTMLPVLQTDSVLATEGNLNNDIGVPQMLFRLRTCHRYAVIEMGMNHVGEIAYLAGLANPSVAVITNAGAAHIEGLGSVESVARAKAEIFAGLDAQGTAIINADDRYASLWRDSAAPRHVIDFGLRERAMVSADYQADQLTNRIQLHLPQGTVALTLQAPGVHNVYNAMAAAATATALNIDRSAIVAGLEVFRGVKGRMQKKCGLHHALLIDDTYNANPESVRAALAVLAATRGKKILVLGDMGELGCSAVELHRSIGLDARQAGLDRMLTLGELSAHAAEAFGSGARHFTDIDELLNVTESLMADDVTLLVKGSRFMHMERVVKQLEQPREVSCC